MELIQTCKEFDVTKADKLGLVNKVVPKEELEEAAFSLTKKISTIDVQISTLIKKRIRDYTEMGFDMTQKRETELHFEHMKREFTGK